MNSKAPTKVRAMLIGSKEFSRRLSAELGRLDPFTTVLSTDLIGAWSALLSTRPEIVIADLSIHHREQDQQQLRALLNRVRERFGVSIYVVAALTAPERLQLGGSLLFKADDQIRPSGLIDTFAVAAPSLIPNTPTLGFQVTNTIELFRHELSRREKGFPPLPQLGLPGWAQSMADPLSRELWMRWLPRYATFLNENPIVVGETGTGKTNFAYALHLLSGRSGSFISVTPRDFSSPELVQAELFGSVQGAYTGAVEKWGLVKSAEKGTLFIDELQSIDKDLQGKIITFIEDKTYRRVGSAERIEADVRFVFATNQSLQEMLRADVLRDDFAYRLERVQLELPPLRQRRLDIGAALAYSTAKVMRQRPYSISIKGFSSDAYRLLYSQVWAGNLRQLENTVAQLCELADMNGETMISEEMVQHVFRSRVQSLYPSISEVISEAAWRLGAEALKREHPSVDASQKRLIELVREVALEACGGNVEQAAELLAQDLELLLLLAHAKEAAK